MKITDLRTRILHLGFRNCVLVTVETDAGITGISETVMKRRTLTIEQSILQLRRYLIGKDPTEIEDHWEKMYRDSFWVGGAMHATAISAVDCALWDVLAKSVGLPVYKLLGGPTRRRVPVYCHCPGGATPEAFAANLKACQARGYHSAKTTLPVFYGVKNETETGYSGTNGHIDRSWKETEYLNPSVFPRIREFFEAGREAVGPDFGIAVDCHGRLNMKAAIRLCRELEDINLMFIEEPVPPENHHVLAEVNRSTTVPIAAGERWATIHGVRPFLEAQAVDILQCDIVNCGGITGLKKIAAMAEAHYISMAPHNPNGPVATLINLQFAACVPNYYQLETIGSEADWQLWHELLDSNIGLDDGTLAVPCAPGFGVKLKEESLDRFPYVAQDGWR
jgi:galactonate dehydratase